MIENIIFAADSYKASHFQAYPSDMDGLFDYVESRGGEYPSTVFFGLQYILQAYFSKPITKEMVEEAKEFFTLHGEPFNYEGWMKVVTECNGYLPITVKAVAEGSVVPTHNVLMTVEALSKDYAWLATYVETVLLRVWYPITVATQSWYIKQVIKGYLEETADSTAGLLFKLHDFGARGVSSQESAMIGGGAHLVNFMGSDTLEGVYMLRKFYGATMAAFSIPALEHSVTTSFGRDNEKQCFAQALQVWGGQGKLLACVSDTYDIFNAVDNIWGKELKQAVVDSGATVVIRPDSGNPAEIVEYVTKSLATSFGYTLNSKGYKVLNNVRIIQGDGVNQKSITEILEMLKKEGFSADNIAFGMGGALLQQLNRDTQKFAMKASAVRRNGLWSAIAKSPITDPGKVSKAGKLMLYKKVHTTVSEQGLESEVSTQFKTYNLPEVWSDKGVAAPEGWTEALETAYMFKQGMDAPYIRVQTLDEIRELSNKQYL